MCIRDSDKAAYRKAERVDFRQSQRLDEGDRVGTHVPESGRHLSGAAGDAGVVEKDDFSLISEAIGDRRIPVVHSAGIVPVSYTHQMCIRDRSRPAERTR